MSLPMVQRSTSVERRAGEARQLSLPVSEGRILIAALALSDPAPTPHLPSLPPTF